MCSHPVAGKDEELDVHDQDLDWLPDALNEPNVLNAPNTVHHYSVLRQTCVDRATGVRSMMTS
jgi:hypothetical protein